MNHRKYAFHKFPEGEDNMQDDHKHAELLRNESLTYTAVDSLVRALIDANPGMYHEWDGHLWLGRTVNGVAKNVIIRDSGCVHFLDPASNWSRTEHLILQALATLVPDYLGYYS